MPIQRRQLLLAGLPLVAATTAQAQSNPTVIWSGFPPGGLGDQVTRPLIDRLKRPLARPRCCWTASPAPEGALPRAS